MSKLTRAIATVAVDRAKKAFPDNAGRGAMVRLGGFDRNEILEMVRLLMGWRPWPSKEVRLAVTTKFPWEGLPSGIAVDVEHTATGFRNSDEPVILFEVEGYSDRQGLGRVFRICDSDLLSGRWGDECRSHLARELWTSRHQRELPEIVLDALERVWGGFKEGNKTPADLRSWATYIDGVFSVIGSNGVVDSRGVWRGVGEQLPLLHLFPDDLLACDSVSQTERTRRIARNVRSSKLVATIEEAQVDDYRSRVESVVFLEADMSESAPDTVGALKSGFRSVLGCVLEPSLKGLQYRYWQQIESSRSRRKGLGHLVRDEIENSAPNRLPEFDALDVLSGLNGRDQESAARLAEAAPEGDDLPLVLVLPLPVQKAVRKLADRTQSVSSRPLGTLLREFHEFVSGYDGDAPRILKLERARRTSQEDHELSTALFAFLFGHALKEVQERVRGERVSLAVEHALVDTASIGRLWCYQNSKGEEELEDEGQEDAPSWESLRLQLSWADDTSGGVSFEWRPKENPGSVMLALLVRHPEMYRWQGKEGEDFEHWLRSSLESVDLLDTGEDLDGDGVLGLWRSARKRSLVEIADVGLVPGVLASYVDVWHETLRGLRMDNCPDGNPDQTVEAFLGFDTWMGCGNDVAVLATHPIKMRWIGLHIEQMIARLVDALRGSLLLNPVNEELFFDWIDSVSPRAHPPAIVVDGRVFLAIQEYGWHEVFRLARDRQGLRSDWLAGLDDESVDAAVGAIETYVKAYPHKVDGLHLLTFIRSGGRSVVIRILRAIRAISSGLGGRSLELVLTLFAPAEEFAALERALQEFDDDDRRGMSEFPAIRVVWHQWEPIDLRLPDLSCVGPRKLGIQAAGRDCKAPCEVDLALVPNLFGTRVEAQESTYQRSEKDDGFDPWLDPTCVLTTGSRDGSVVASVSRRLLPDVNDSLLEAWSTVCVRQFRTHPVSRTDREDAVDFFEFRVPFADTASFFSKLHECAHWVVTLDQFVGREQIEALEGAPDIILAKSRLGSSGTHGLVVSALAGRDFIIERLARRLNQQLPESPDCTPHELAEKVYEHGRLLVPGILLRALGLGRTAQEIVGLVVSRRRVDEEIPVHLGEGGFEGWISLDEHYDWFGGGNRSRADLVRVSGRWNVESNDLEVDVLVVECKFRKSTGEAKADAQISYAIRLFNEALETGDRERPDGGIWRRVILNALRLTKKGVSTGSWCAPLRVVWGNRPQADIPVQLREKWQRGLYTLRSVRGVLCSLRSGSEVAPAETTLAGHRLLTCSVAEIAEILARLDREIVTEPEEIPVNEKRLIHGDPHPGCDVHHLLPMYQKLIDVLSSHGVGAQAVDADAMLDGPGFYVFRVKLPMGVAPKQVHRLQEELQYGLGLPAGLLPRSYVDRSHVVIEVPKEESARSPVWAQDVWADCLWPDDALYAPIGVDVRRQPVGINFSSAKSPHLLIGGMTGGGKSVALETILRGLLSKRTSDELRLFIVDPKGTEFTDFEDAPHLEGGIGLSSGDGIELLQRCVAEMDRRYGKMRDLAVRDLATYNKKTPTTDRLPWWLAVLDEFADLTAERDARREIESLVQRLAQKARACGIHVIVATQKPSADVISTTIRSNLGAQLALRVRSSIDSRVIMEDPGAESLAGNGDAFLRLSGEEKRRIQCAMYRV